MARGGLYKSDIQKARDTLRAQGKHPSVDAVRVALGNTGSKTTIHRYLKELEEELGRPLFVRSSHRIHLTDEGQLLRKRAEDILDMVDKTASEFKSLDEITGGDIRIGERSVVGLAPGARDVAMVFQHYALYPHMSVRDNMAFGLRNINMADAEIDRRVTEAARMLELTELLERKPMQMSGGQRQRVAISRAVVKEPGVFLFDEPLSNLDAALRTRTRVELARLHQRLKTTMVFVTHDQIEAMTLANRIVVMNKGRIEQVGTPMEVYHFPATRFVAGFIGSPVMNFFPGPLVPSGNDFATLRIAGGFDLATRVPLAALPRSALHLLRLPQLPCAPRSRRVLTAPPATPLPRLGADAQPDDCAAGGPRGADDQHGG